MKRSLGTILWTVLAVAVGLALFKYSMQLAAVRLFQVDECQNIFMARILATGQAESFFTGVTLYMAPLVWLARDVTQSVDLFTSARIFSLMNFWLNLLLIAMATGERLSSRWWLVALLGAATLAPLWDYGFEIRHDNLLLTGMLLTWCLVRFRPAGVATYLIAGAIAMAMQFTAFKAFVYTVPIALAILVFPPPGSHLPRWKLALAWVTGAFGMFLVIRAAYGFAGIWGTYLAGFQMASDASVGKRFAPWGTMLRLFNQTPLLLALVVAALTSFAVDFRRRGRVALAWSGILPEALLFLIALAGLVLNPVPHPYNLVNLVPFAFLLSFRYATGLLGELWTFRSIRPLVITVFLFAHLVPFWMVTRRHMDWPNFRQIALMQLAEDLTNPASDRVYDGVGLVPSRASINYRWLLHSLNMRSFRDPGSRVRDMLAERPAAVVIQNYRTDWLPGEDHEFIRKHYVALGDDFWVLGTTLPKGGSEFETIHPGRYRILFRKQSNLLGTYPEGLAELIKAAATKETEVSFSGTLDGAMVSDQPVELKVGTHRIESAGDDEVAVVWVGPRLEKPPQVGRGDHRRLFVNWY